MEALQSLQEDMAVLQSLEVMEELQEVTPVLPLLPDMAVATPPQPPATAAVPVNTLEQLDKVLPASNNRAVKAVPSMPPKALMLRVPKAPTQLRLEEPLVLPTTTTRNSAALKLTVRPLATPTPTTTATVLQLAKHLKGLKDKPLPSMLLKDPKAPWEPTTRMHMPSRQVVPLAVPDMPCKVKLPSYNATTLNETTLKHTDPSLLHPLQSIFKISNQSFLHLQLPTALTPPCALHFLFLALSLCQSLLSRK
jgi:hypothetical protein